MGDEQHQQHLAAAALMVEVMVIDRKISNKELFAIKKIFDHQFDLRENEIDQLLDLAKQEVDEDPSLFHVTHLINDHFDAKKKRDSIKKL